MQLGQLTLIYIQSPIDRVLYTMPHVAHHHSGLEPSTHLGGEAYAGAVEDTEAVEEAEAPPWALVVEAAAAAAATARAS